MGSSNGTYLNGQKIGQTPVPLIAGAVLRLGEEGPKVSVSFEAAAPMPRTAPSMPVAKTGGGGGRLLVCLVAFFLMALVGLTGAVVVYFVLQQDTPAGDVPEGEEPADGADAEVPAVVDPAPSDAEPQPSEAEADDEADLSHVSVGQVYVYEMSGGMVSEWTVDAVETNKVTYTTVNKMDMGQGLQPLGDPAQQAWEYVVPESTGEASDEPKPETSRESVTVGGIEFDCLVVESEAGGTQSKTWATMSPGSETVATFPGVVKSVANGDTVMELVDVRAPE
jgi:hypothetical protein